MADSSKKMTEVKMKDGSTTAVYYQGEKTLEDKKKLAQQKSDKKALGVGRTYIYNPSRGTYE